MGLWLVGCFSEFTSCMYPLTYCPLSHSACVLVDGVGGALGVTIYNLAATTHFATGDVFTIPDPLLCHTSTLDEVSHVCVWQPIDGFQGAWLHFWRAKVGV